MLTFVLVTALQGLQAPQAYDGTFSQIDRVVELQDGRLIVHDYRERELWLVAKDQESGALVSRKGNGPGEFQFPSRIFPLGDTGVVFWDRAATRLTSCAVRRSTICTSHRVDERAVRAFDIVGADLKGGFYFIDFPTSGLGVNDDSVHAIRVALPDGHVDTLGTFGAGIRYMRISKRSNETISLSMPVPLVAADLLVVASDGTLFSFPRTGKEMKVTPLNESSRRIGLTPPQEQAPYTSVERDSLLRDADTLGFAASLKDALPQSKGAYVPKSLVQDHKGLLWLGVYRDDQQKYYVAFDRNGKLRQEARLPADCRLVGAGRTVLYTACKDEDGLETLHTKPIPVSD